MVNVVLLLINGHVKDVNIPLDSKSSQKTFDKLLIDKKFNEKLNKNIENLGKGKLKKINTWNIESNILNAYGFTSGDEENNHELPPSDNSDICYGDILMVKTNSKKQLQTMSSEDYESIYTSLFNGNNQEESEYSDSDNYEDNEDNENSDSDENDVISNIDSDDDESEEDTEQSDNDELMNVDEEEWDNPIEEEIDTKHIIRQNNIKLFKDIVDEEIAHKVEESIFRFTKDTSKKRKIPVNWDSILFKKIYINKSRSMFSNLKKDSYVRNTNLLKKINSNEIDVINIASMTNQELFPEHWKELLDAKYKKDKFMYEGKTEAMTDQFKCGRCKSRECTYYEMQTRSADEGMTCFITCLNCGNRWKQ